MPSGIQAQAAPASGAGAPPKRMGTFYALRFRDFQFLWAGTMFSSLGQWIQQTTLGWVVYDLTGSTSLLGAINGVRSLPMLFFGPLGGVAADRMNRKALLVGTQAFLMIVSFALAVGLFFGAVRTWHLFVFTFLTGVAWAFNMPVRQSVMFNVVPRFAVPNAVALNSAAFNVTRILGPSAAGFLISALGPEGNFMVQSAAYLGVTASMFMIAVPALQNSAAKKSVMNNLGEGMRYVAKDKIVLTLMLMGLFPVFFAMPYVALLPVFAKDVFGGGPKGFGFLLSALGVGGLLGGLITASLGRFERRGLMQLAAMAVFGGGLVLFSFMHTMWTGAAMLVITGCTQMIFMTTNQTLLQLNIPDEMRGRITSIYMLDQGLVPLGTLMAGVAAEYLGAPRVVTVMGVVCVGLAVVIFTWMPRVRNMRLSGPEAAALKGRGRH
jgi:MFS family permease